jgi:hypothetical protein
MNVEAAQREVRTTFVGGGYGGFVSGALWLASAAAATWGTRRLAIQILLLGGMFIFPLTVLVMRLAGRKASLSHENPFTGLAMQTAFIVPLLIPVALAATLYQAAWFYPAMMMIVGAHYLPFITLYGMRAFAVLAGLLLMGGLMLGLYRPHDFAIGGWATGVLLVVFGAWALARYVGESAKATA